METVHIYRLQPNKKLFEALRDTQMEAAKVWNFCVEMHKQARREHLPWHGRSELQKATKGGRFALHSQSVQMVVHAFLMLVVYRSQRVNHCSWSRSLRGQATPLECDRSSLPQRRVESVTLELFL